MEFSFTREYVLNFKLALKYVNLFLFIDAQVKKLMALKTFQIISTNSHLIVVLGEFNKRSKNWYINDKTTTDGAKIEFVISQYGLSSDHK